MTCRKICKRVERSCGEKCMWLIVGYALGVGEVAFSEEENVLWCHRTHRDFVGTLYLESVN